MRAKRNLGIAPVILEIIKLQSAGDVPVSLMCLIKKTDRTVRYANLFERYYAVLAIIFACVATETANDYGGH